MRYISKDKDIKMKSDSVFWITHQKGYVVLNWLSDSSRYRLMCHHLALFPEWDRDALESLVNQLSQLLEMADRIDA